MAHIPKIQIDQRKLTKNIEVEIELVNNRWFGFGLLFIRIGCWIAGLKYVENEEQIAVCTCDRCETKRNR